MMCRVSLLAGAAISLAACGGNAGTAPKQGTDAILDYYKAKRVMAEKLQKDLTGITGSEVYTLVAINGPAYPIGSLIADDNKIDLESRDCQLEASELPAPEPWSSVPSAKIDKTFNFSLSIPAPMRRVFQGADSSISGGLNWAQHSYFELNDMSQTFLSRADLRRVLARPACAAALAEAQDSKALFVRGIVYGQEKLTSSRQFNPNLTVRVMSGDTGQFVLNYNNEGAFALTETTPAPKFYIIAKVKSGTVTKSTGKGPIGDPSDEIEDMFGRPGDAAVTRIEALRDKED